MLISFGGLPGVGKTTIARELARQIGGVYLRIDSIEQAIRDANVLPPTRELDDAGYRAAYAVAEDNLRLGRTVVADCVNPDSVTRDAWRVVAANAGIKLVEVEITCSDTAEHRKRVGMRQSTVRGLVLPSWQQVVDRDYEAWERPHLVIDTAHQSIQSAVDSLRHALPL